MTMPDTSPRSAFIPLLVSGMVLLAGSVFALAPIARCDWCLIHEVFMLEAELERSIEEHSREVRCVGDDQSSNQVDEELSPVWSESKSGELSVPLIPPAVPDVAECPGCQGSYRITPLNWLNLRAIPPERGNRSSR